MLYRIAQPVGPSARAREFGNLRAQLENSERQRIIIHAGPASSAAPFFDIEYEIGSACVRISRYAAEAQSKSAAISCSISTD